MFKRKPIQTMETNWESDFIIIYIFGHFPKITSSFIS